MTNPIEGIEEAKPQPRFDPFTGKPLNGEPAPTPSGADFWEAQKAAAEPIHVAPTIPEPPANSWAAGWAPVKREQLDVTLPSGKMCRVKILQREDLFRMNLMGYLDTFTPMLMEDTISSEERDRRMRDKMKSDSNAIANMFMAVDEVVKEVTVRPRITMLEDEADYGGPSDWANPEFIPTAYIGDIDMEDRFAIFAAAFGKSMDDLKSLWQQTPGVGSMADESSVPPTS